MVSLIRVIGVNYPNLLLETFLSCLLFPSLTGLAIPCFDLPALPALGWKADDEEALEPLILTVIRAYLAFAASEGIHWATAYSALNAEQQHLLHTVQLAKLKFPSNHTYLQTSAALCDCNCSANIVTLQQCTTKAAT